MTAHELARYLLAGPDLEVVTFDPFGTLQGEVEPVLDYITPDPTRIAGYYLEANEGDAGARQVVVVW